MEEITMRKFLVLMLALALAFAFTSTAYAATIPAGAITITAQSVDYVSALAGIAKPTTAAHHENERVAVLVTVAVPQWYDVANMSVAVEQHGLVLDSTAGLAVASGNYLLYGTLYSTTGRLTITMQDNALTGAATAQALWAALYGDRTVSATVDFAPATAIQPAAIRTTEVLEIPQTGDAPGAALAVVLMAGALILAAVIWRRTRKTN